jgi:hypothetical protein
MERTKVMLMRDCRFLGSLLTTLLEPYSFRRLSPLDGQPRGFLMRIRALIVACLLAISGLLIRYAGSMQHPATVYIYKVYFDSSGPTGQQLQS